MGARDVSILATNRLAAFLSEKAMRRVQPHRSFVDRAGVYTMQVQSDSQCDESGKCRESGRVVG